MRIFINRILNRQGMKSIEFNEEKSLLLTLLDMFDSDWYMSNYPALAENNVDPLTDYILCGADVGRNPNSLFDTGWYLEQYPEVKNSEINPLIHYIKKVLPRVIILIHFFTLNGILLNTQK